jgi:hypothetical protein
MTLRSKVRSGGIHGQRWLDRQALSLKLTRLQSQLGAREQLIKPEGQPVIFFNASSRLQFLSQNGAFSLLTSWGLRLSGTPVRYFVCDHGTSQCQLGAVGQPSPEAPPCQGCTRLSNRLFSDHLMDRFGPLVHSSNGLPTGLNKMNIPELREVEYKGLPLGEICLPSLRWSLRMHHVEEDPQAEGLYRKFIASAAFTADQFERLLDREDPRAVVLFSGVTYPEAVVRQIALQKSVPVISHEVSMRPMSGFFSHGQATAYPIEIPSGFVMGDEENRALDGIISKRMKGDFTMAGIRFWPDMQPMNPIVAEKIDRFRQMAVVFTNVIFDTSQIHANVLFRHMFSWLDHVLDLARSHEDTLFIIRAHPDEIRRGKASRETVQSYLQEVNALQLQNVLFIAPEEMVSSYELIQRSKFVMVYNSSIGLEASILGSPVLCAGKARYTQYPTVFFPESLDQYSKAAEKFLLAETIETPQEFIDNARAFFYQHYFHASIDFSRFLISQKTLPGQVLFDDFDIDDLHPDNLQQMAVLRDGILDGKPFQQSSNRQVKARDVEIQKQRRPSGISTVIPGSIRQPIRRVRNSIRRSEQRRRFGFSGDTFLPILASNSFPKSGTNLLLQVLAGLDQIGPFLDLTGQPILTFEVSTGRKRSQAEINLDLEHMEAGDIFSAHLHATEENMRQLCRKEIVNYFIYRDPRDVVVSHAFFVTQMAPEHVHHEYYANSLKSFDERLMTSITGRPNIDLDFPDIGKRFEPYLKWLECDEVLAIRFEDLIEDRKHAISRIWDHFCASSYQVEIDRDKALEILEVGIDPAKSPTYRSGKVGEWSKYFKPEHNAKFKEVTGELLVQMGYEKDHTW